MRLTIYHNPSCSKSRKTLELIEQHGITPNIVEYLKTPPDAPTVLRLANLLALPVNEMLRSGEEDYAGLTAGGDVSDAALAAGLAEFPKALQRPIVVDDEGDRAIIGRPPENVLQLIGE